MADGDDYDLQFAVVDFVDDAIVTHANAPSGAAFEFFHTGSTRVVFQFTQAVENAAANVIRQPVELFLNRPRQDAWNFMSAGMIGARGIRPAW